jgi:hypothetical protein
LIKLHRYEEGLAGALQILVDEKIMRKGSEVLLSVHPEPGGHTPHVAG